MSHNISTQLIFVSEPFSSCLGKKSGLEVPSFVPTHNHKGIESTSFENPVIHYSLNMSSRVFTHHSFLKCYLSTALTQ